MYFRNKKPVKNYVDIKYEKIESKGIQKFDIDMYISDDLPTSLDGYTSIFSIPKKTTSKNDLLITDYDYTFLTNLFPGINDQELISPIQRLDFLYTEPLSAKKYQIESSKYTKTELLTTLLNEIDKNGRDEFLKIKSFTLYNIYKALRRCIMVQMVRDRTSILKEVAFYGHLSGFKNCEDFLEFVSIRKTFILSNDFDDLLKRKIMMYVIFITSFEIRQLILEDNRVLKKFKDDGLTQLPGIQATLDSIIFGFYYKAFSARFSEDKNFYGVSLYKFFKNILNCSYKVNSKYQEIYNYFATVKSRNPYLKFINEISISDRDNEIIPLNFIDSMLYCYIEMFYPN
ncbi:hypothetical protein NGRA_0341 [Nosema granulosis]|uniref:Uncharacterized protein n=1 Tax=Nosema granulosis TaxID=83296 RepID=A0A9P6H271_9MICR|nr:hypothetical protein NGRA_0341 [Nosema granulosis]